MPVRVSKLGLYVDNGSHDGSVLVSKLGVYVDSGAKPGDLLVSKLGLYVDVQTVADLDRRRGFMNFVP